MFEVDKSSKSSFSFALTLKLKMINRNKTEVKTIPSNLSICESWRNQINNKLTMISQGKSYLIFSFLIFIVTNNNAIEKTIPILAIFEPITFEIAISLESFKTELTLINNSGADVANETIVRPITSFETLYLSDKSTEFLKANHFND